MDGTGSSFPEICGTSAIDGHRGDNNNPSSVLYVIGYPERGVLVDKEVSIPMGHDNRDCPDCNCFP